MKFEERNYDLGIDDLWNGAQKYATEFGLDETTDYLLLMAVACEGAREVRGSNIVRVADNKFYPIRKFRQSIGRPVLTLVPEMGGNQSCSPKNNATSANECGNE